GLGLSHLSSSALFIEPEAPFLDTSTNAPDGQPTVWANPQAPGALSWKYSYVGNGNARQYQDFAVGLPGVNTDGKVLNYSDSTVTLAWQGKDQSGRPQQLQATMGEGLPFVYFTVPTAKAGGGTIQLATTPKSSSVID